MFRVVPSGRTRWVRTILVTLVLLGMVTTSLAASVGAPSHLSVRTPVSGLTPASHTAPAVQKTTHNTPPIHSQPVSRSSHPSLTGTSTFWQTVGVANQPFNSSACTSYAGFYTYNYCYNQAVSPQLLTLPNGDVGVVYSLITNSTNVTTCAGSASSVYTLVGFQLSTNNGQSFGPISYIGNSSCSWLDAIEPSFAVSSNGDIYGTYVAYNSSTNQGSYTYRASDALEFTESTDNGATFSQAVSLNYSNVARPQIATFGDSIYILYENISNGSGTYVSYGQYGYSTANPISENLLVSTDGGATWGGPYNVPGINSTTFNIAFGGSIAVNATGTVGISYFTNHTCVANVIYYVCYDSGDDLVAAASTTNGTSWNGPWVVQKGVGESYYYMDGWYLGGFFQVTPNSNLVFDSTGTQMYVTWTGDYNKTQMSGATCCWYYDYTQSGLFFASGTVSGTGWFTVPVFVPLNLNDYDDFWNPSLGYSNGELYLTYTQSNTTYCYSACSPLDGEYIQWLQTSTNGGASWSPETFVGIANTCNYGYCNTYNAGSSFGGLSSSVGFTASGTPLLAYALPQSYQYTFSYCGIGYCFNYTYPTLISVAQPWFGETLWENFTQSGLAPGIAWSININGNIFTTTDTFVNITNIPYGGEVFIGGIPLQEAYGTEASPALSVPGADQFYQNGTVYVNYTLAFLFKLSVQPANAYDVGVNFNDPSTGMYYYYDIYTGCPTCTPNVYWGPAGDWYFANGTPLQLTTFGYPLGIGYWTGSGTGSYTGAGSQANITVNAPINETAWEGGFSQYTVNVTSVGVPSTSTYHFAFDGTNYSASGGSLVNISNVGTGVHEVTNVWADSTTAGWAYFGWPSPADPIMVPDALSISLYFAYEDVGSPMGTVTFQAQGFTTGTVWSVSFNGTTYSSDTPWINITTHTGTYRFGAFPATSQNGSVGYTPTGVSSPISVTTGSTYMVDYVQAYKVTVSAGNGGSTTGAGSTWFANGASASFTASAHSGYAFGGWTGEGLGSYTGPSTVASVTVNGPIVEVASFYPLPASRFNLTFTETGLAAGTWWSVFLGGTGYSSNAATFTVGDLLSCSSPGGNYNLSIPYAYSSDGMTRYVPTSHLSRTICTTGSTSVNEVFGAQYYLQLQATAGGYATATIGFNTITGSAWVASGTVVQLGAVLQTGYIFLGWNGTGTGSITAAGPNPSQSIVMEGPIVELASFQLPIPPQAPTFTIDFHSATTLSTGTSWSVTLTNASGSWSFSSTGSDVVVSQLYQGTYTLAVPTTTSADGLTEYASFGNPTSVQVTHNATISLTFSLSFWVDISGTAGGVVSPASKWEAQGGSILVNATANVGYNFVAWNCSLGASCSSDLSQYPVKVTAPLSLVATFAPIPTSQTGTQVSSPSFWSSWTTWAGLAAVGLLVGLVVGLLLGRRGARPPAAESAPAEPATAEPVPPTEGGSS